MKVFRTKFVSTSGIPKFFFQKKSFSENFPEKLFPKSLRKYFFRKKNYWRAILPLHCLLGAPAIMLGARSTSLKRGRFVTMAQYFMTRSLLLLDNTHPIRNRSTRLTVLDTKKKHFFLYKTDLYCDLIVNHINLLTFIFKNYINYKFWLMENITKFILTILFYNLGQHVYLRTRIKYTFLRGGLLKFQSNRQ